MKTLSKILFFVLFAGSLTIYMASCDKSDPILENVINTNVEISDRSNLVPEEEIDKFIVDWISTHRTTFDWDNAPDEMLYSALMYGDSILTISFKVGASTDKREFYRQNRRLPSDWISERENIIDFVLAGEKLHRNNERLLARNLLPFPLNNRLAVINIKVTNPSTISNLRDKYHVKLDPPSYIPLSFRGGEGPPLTGSPSLGCNPASQSIDSNDYFVWNGAWASWNYSNHRIPDAWTCTQGENIEVCIIDTGVSDNQPYLSQSNFDPHSPPSGRSIIKDVELPQLEEPCFGTLGSPPEDWLCSTFPQNDECGHGTAMAGVIGAPFISNSSIGVAYKADLYTIKASHDVYINAVDELMGVTNAITEAANRPQTKIISMSLARLSPNGNIVDALMSADGNGKMIFAAAGTSTILTTPHIHVMFPADRSYVHAVTGENESFGPCTNCHWGTEVEFTAVMQKGFLNPTGPITLASEPGMKYTGGASCATATVAGIAALVWSKYPTESATSIISRLVVASSNYEPGAPNQGRSLTTGWGYIDAYSAVDECY